MSETQHQHRSFGGVAKDPLDLRDLMYEANLRELPFQIDNRRRVSIILDQGKEGACTGFGLAAVVNFLLCNRSDTSKADKQRLQELRYSASARMLYEMAKRYDEWEGENYEGSSIRGAMKGWHRHGVCTWSDWPYDPKQPGRLTPDRQLKALGRPLGAYFRVRHLHLNHMQSALNEAAILYASASVHEGWYEVDPHTGKIPYRQQKAGGHAFAIVGYDADGFWVQNSWGPDWGLNGFCHISYDDWLENSYDCWVARLGVPTVSLALMGEAGRGRVKYFDYIPHESVVLNTIRPHFVNLGNDGQLSSSGIYATQVEDIEHVVLKGFQDMAQTSPQPAKLLLYAHGGLNGEKASASRIASLLPYFLANRIYPIHFMWETGLWDSIQGILEDAFRRGRFQGWRDTLRDKFYDLLDEAIELGSRALGQPVWSQMKQNAALASVGNQGGARIIAQQMKSLFETSAPPPELHLVGHSAGSIFHAHLLTLLVEFGIPVKTLTFFAPACTMELFKTNVQRFVGREIKRLTVFNLTDEAEQDDSVGPVYHKSLLYLVSEAFEPKRGTSLLGMETHVAQESSIKRTLGKQAFANETTVVHSAGGPSSVRLTSHSKTHGGFDNDEETLNSMLRIIGGKNGLEKAF